MHRNTMLVLAAGLTGALSTAFAGHFLMTPAVAHQASELQSAERTATVDVLKLLERMLDTEEYIAGRESESRVWNDQVGAIAAERDGYLAALQQLDPTQAESPQAQALYTQYQDAQQRFLQKRQEAAMAVDAMAAGQLSRAYQEVHATVQRVAAEQGYDRVFSSRMAVDNLDASNTNVIVQEVLLRPVLYTAAADDLTATVMEALGIPEQPEPAPEGPVPAPTPAPAEDGASTPPAGG